MGHQKGMERFEKLYETIVEMKIPYFSFWGASYDNLTKRSEIEIQGLLNLFHLEFKKLLNDERVMEKGIKIDVIGRWREIFPKETKEIINECIKKTKSNEDLHLTFLLAYNGTDEMVHAITQIKEKSLDVNAENIKSNLWTKNLPPVDFVIRTGVDEDLHNSAGFMMWDTAYSQLYFTKTLFPDLDKEELKESVNNFNLRERRYGK